MTAGEEGRAAAAAAAEEDEDAAVAAGMSASSSSSHPPPDQLPVLTGAAAAGVGSAEALRCRAVSFGLDRAAADAGEEGAAEAGESGAAAAAAEEELELELACASVLAFFLSPPVLVLRCGCEYSRKWSGFLRKQVAPYLHAGRSSSAGDGAASASSSSASSSGSGSSSAGTAAAGGESRLRFDTMSGRWEERSGQSGTEVSAELA